MTAANSTSKESDEAASSGNSATQVPASADRASSTPAPSIQTPAQPRQASSTSVAANISDTLKTTLDVIRMFVAFRAKHYSDVLSMAEPLIARNNPIAMYFKAGILTNGLAGERDLSQARALMRDAAQRGDPTSLLFMGRFLEHGIGGPQDMDTAKRLYVLAAQGMANGAVQDVARLGLSGEVNMTAMDAYQTIVANTATRQVIQDAGNAMTSLTRQNITPAVCLSAQLGPLVAARGWNVHDNTTGDNVGANQIVALQLKSFRFGAPRGDPWCEWGMGELASRGAPNYPKNLVEADVFYRLAALSPRLGADAKQVKQQLATVENEMTTGEKAQADGLFHSAIPASMAR